MIKWFIAPVILIFLWLALYYSEIIAESALPEPSATLLKLVDMHLILIQLATESWIRLVMGVSLGFVCAFVAASLAFKCHFFRNSLGNVLAFLAPIPVVVWLPITISILGDGDTQNIALIAIGSLLLIYGAVLDAFDLHGPQYESLFDLYRKSSIDRFKLFFLPLTILGAGSVLRIAFALAWIVLFFTEFGINGSAGGVGNFIRQNKDVGKTEEVFAGLIILGLFAAATDFVVRVAVGYALRWQKGDVSG